MARNKISLKTVNNEILNGYSWTIDSPKANVVIITGMEEYLLRYDDFANYLNSQGFNVYGVDHYGQGDSVNDEKELGIVPRSFFSKMVRNVDDLVKRVRKENGLPTYIFAHSMGSFMLQDFIQRFSKDADKVVICGTNGPNGAGAYKFGYPIARFIAKCRGENRKAKFLASLAVGAYSKSIKHRKTPVDWLSYNEDNNQRYLEHPKCGYGSSNGFYRELLKGNRRLYNKKFMVKIRKDLPIFLIAGIEDPVGAKGKGPTKLAELYKKYGLTNVELKLYDHMRHEILNEPDHKVVYEDVVNFLNK